VRKPAYSIEQSGGQEGARTNRNRSYEAISFPTAEESARNWLAYRESHGTGPTPEESAKNWLAYREAQNQPSANISEDDQSNTKRGRDHDASL